MFKEMYTDEELINILIDRAAILGKTPTVQAMAQFGPPYVSLYQRRFASYKNGTDGWNNTLTKAGFRTNRKLVDQETEKCGECGCDGKTSNGKLIRWMGTNEIYCIKHYQQKHYRLRA